MGEKSYDNERNKTLDLSPFSKHCANLSPLYKNEKMSMKGFDSRMSSKFSVEFMKSPNIKNINEGSLRKDHPDIIKQISYIIFLFYY